MADLKEWQITGVVEDIEGFRERMGPPPTEERFEGNDAALQTWGRLFNRPNQQGSYRFPLQIRTRRLEVAGTSYFAERPLFGGEWRFRNYIYGNPNESRTVRTTMAFELNPTRFARYQSPVPFPPADNADAWPDPAFVAERSVESGNGEIVLDGKDNWLHDSQRFNAFTNPQRWQHHLRRYFAVVESVLAAEIHRIQMLHDNAVHCAFFQRPANLRLVETYWEFSSENPVALVESLWPLLRTFSSQHRSEELYGPIVENGVERNAVFIAAKVRAGEQVRIYAKTNRRIRIEVQHQLDEFSELAEHTAPTWLELIPLVNALSNHAVDTVNAMLQHFAAHHTLPASHMTPLDLVTEIAFHCGDAEVARWVMNELVSVGAIATVGEASPAYAAIRSMRSAGILSYQPSNGYTVTANYAAALQRLQNDIDCSLFTQPASVSAGPLS